MKRFVEALISTGSHGYSWMLDILSASYYATEWHDSVLNPDSTAVHSVVAKTRGKMQYYQNQENFAFDLTWHDLEVRKRPMINATATMSQLEAEALNHALSVRRKAVSGLVVILLGVVLEVVGVDISLLTSDATEVTINMPELESSTRTPE